METTAIAVREDKWWGMGRLSLAEPLRRMSVAKYPAASGQFLKPICVRARYNRWWSVLPYPNLGLAVVALVTLGVVARRLLSAG